MKRHHFIWDTENGFSGTDAKVASSVDEMLKQSEPVRIGTELIITRIRQLICEKTLDHNDVSIEISGAMFYFDNNSFLTDNDGTFVGWPVGFCDVYQEMLIAIVMRQK